jgi:hypothetical protein
MAVAYWILKDVNKGDDGGSVLLSRNLPEGTKEHAKYFIRAQVKHNTKHD